MTRKFRLFSILFFPLLLASCNFTSFFWKRGGLNAIPLVGLTENGTELVRYLPKRIYKNKLKTPTTLLVKKFQGMLDAGDDNGHWRFGQITLGLKIGTGVQFTSLFSTNFEAHSNVVLRKRKYIY